MTYRRFKIPEGQTAKLKLLGGPEDNIECGAVIAEAPPSFMHPFLGEVFGFSNQQDFDAAVAKWNKEQEGIENPFEREARWDKDEEGNCRYCGARCFDGEGCDEAQAGGFDK